MSEEKEIKPVEQSKFNKVNCPLCGNQLNLQTKKSVDYTIKRAENRAWCRSCQRWIKFSLD